LCLLLLIGFSSLAQSINHWETAIHNDDTWHFHIGSSEPASDWMKPSFDHTAWNSGPGGFGYGDGDDNTTIASTISVYLTKDFTLVDTSVIKYAILHADYDDAFVAYLNGNEIARNNIGTQGVPPKHDDLATTFKEATLYSGGTPESYALDGTSLRSLLMKGTNTLSIQVHNHTSTSSDLSSNFFLSLGISDQSRNYTPTPSWFEAPYLGSTLPLVIISTNNETIQDEPKITAHMGIIDHGYNNLTDAYNGYDGQIAIEIRGASSQSFPKKNYGFETQLANGENNNISIIGMPAENDWVLHGPYSDKSLLRNTLAYHMGQATGRYTPRTRLCELFINDTYEGVYMMTEKIKRDKNRVDLASLKEEDLSGEELTGGYIFQIDRDDANSNIDGWYSSTSPSKFYAYHDPKPDELATVQREYLKEYVSSFESDMKTSDFENKFQNYVDLTSWIDYFLVTEIGKHIDAYKLSFYMHKKKITNGGKIHFGPLWDFNLAFGNFDFACSPDPQGWTYEFQGTCDNSHPFWIKKMTNIPEVSNQINCRWNGLRDGPLHTDSLMDFLNLKELEMGNAPKRNFERWEILGEYVWPNDYVGETYDEEITFLKNWLTTRLEWMDDNMLGDCSLASIEKQDEVYSLAGAYPNPATDYFYLETQLANYQNARLKMFNSLGQEVLSMNINNSIEKVHLGNLPKGIYNFKISVGGLEKSSSNKLIVQ